MSTKETWRGTSLPSNFFLRVFRYQQILQPLNGKMRVKKVEKGKSSFLMEEKAPLMAITKGLHFLEFLREMFQVFMGMRQISFLHGPEEKPLYDIKWKKTKQTNLDKEREVHGVKVY